MNGDQLPTNAPGFDRIKLSVKPEQLGGGHREQSCPVLDGNTRAQCKSPLTLTRPFGILNLKKWSIKWLFTLRSRLSACSLMLLSHLCFRPAASDLLRACVLVLHSLLWTKPAGRRNIPRLSAFPHCGWLHRPLQFRALLPGPAVQCQPQRHCGDDPETYRYPRPLQLVYHQVFQLNFRDKSPKN